jgi:hypothetical protein
MFADASHCEFGLLKREGMVKVRLGNGASSPVDAFIKIPNTPVFDTESGENGWPYVLGCGVIEIGIADRPSRPSTFLTPVILHLEYATPEIPC